MSRVLILDQENDWRSLLQRLLEREGHQVITSANQDEALEWEQSSDFDLFIVNLRRGQDGRPFPADLPTHWPKKTSIMVIADYLTEDDARRLGADEYLVMPVEIETIESKVRELFEKTRP